MKLNILFLAIVSLLLGIQTSLKAQGAGKLQLFGIVKDSSTNAVVEFATIAIFPETTDSLITGAVTDLDGKFLVNDLTEGNYRVKVTFMGYREKWIPSLKIQKDKPKYDLGTLYIQPSDKMLEAVEIVGEREFIENNIDRKVYNTKAMISAQGGTASDLLVNLPSIDVDINGGISLRGNQNVTILIDGKPSGLTGSGRQGILDRVPASSIERVEVITNPSAKYDPDGMAGIINIVLKKEKSKGINGSYTGSVGSRNKYNSSLNLNYNAGKINWFANYDFRYESRFRKNGSKRTTTYTDSLAFLEQDGYSLQRTPSHNIKTGFDIAFHPKWNATITGMWNTSDEKSDEILRYLTYSNNSDFDSYYRRFNGETQNSNNQEYAFLIDRTFEKKGQSLVAFANYSQAHQLENGNYLQKNYESDYKTETSDFQKEQINDILETNQIFTAQIDYTQPVGEFGKFETGYKNIFRDIDNDFYSETMDSSSLKFVEDLNLSNHFHYKERIFAGYGIWSNSKGKINYQVGLRVEQTNTSSKLINTNETFDNNYFNFFPSAHISYVPTKATEYRLSYSRRINRPSVGSLNPFTDYSDPLNLRVGNPFLQPEYINSYEGSMMKYGKNSSLTSTIYYRQTLDMMTRMRTYDDATGISMIRFVNFSSSLSYGAEFIYVLSPFEWWNINASFNVYQTVINAENVETDLNNSATNWTSKLLMDFNIKENGGLQISSRYSSPRVIAQGEIGAMYGVDLAYRHNILKGKGTLSFRISDIFNTQRFQVYTETGNFYQESRWKRETRIAFLSFSYRFGKPIKGKKSKLPKGNSEFGGGGMDM